MKNKKADQLGMNPSTAAGRLRKDLLFHFAAMLGHTQCYRCQEKLTKDTFSIDHIEPWLDSDNPIELYFKLSNVAFSHHSCNCGAARHPTQKYFTDAEKLEAQKRWGREEYIRRRDRLAQLKVKR